MNYNLQSGLSWHEWISDPQNKALYEWNQSEAMKKYRRDEDEFISEIILQERIQQNKQLIEQQESILNPGIGSYAGAAGGAAAGAGGWHINTGIGSYSIGTFLNAQGEHTDTLSDEGFERFTII